MLQQLCRQAAEGELVVELRVASGKLYHHPRCRQQQQQQGREMGEGEGTRDEAVVYIGIPGRSVRRQIDLSIRKAVGW